MNTRTYVVSARTLCVSVLVIALASLLITIAYCDEAEIVFQARSELAYLYRCSGGDGKMPLPRYDQPLLGSLELSVLSPLVRDDHLHFQEHPATGYITFQGNSVSSQDEALLSEREEPESVLVLANERYMHLRQDPVSGFVTFFGDASQSVPADAGQPVVDESAFSLVCRGPIATWRVNMFFVAHSLKDERGATTVWIPKGRTWKPEELVSLGEANEQDRDDYEHFLRADTADQLVLQKTLGGPSALTLIEAVLKQRAGGDYMHLPASIRYRLALEVLRRVHTRDDGLTAVGQPADDPAPSKACRIPPTPVSADAVFAYLKEDCVGEHLSTQVRNCICLSFYRRLVELANRATVPAVDLQQAADYVPTGIRHQDQAAYFSAGALLLSSIEKKLLLNRVKLPGLDWLLVSPELALWIFGFAGLCVLVTLRSRLARLAGPDPRPNEPWLMLDAGTGAGRLMAVVWVFLVQLAPWIGIAGVWIVGVMGTDLYGRQLSPEWNLLKAWDLIRFVGCLALAGVSGYLALTSAGLIVAIRKKPREGEEQPQAAVEAKPGATA